MATGLSWTVTALGPIVFPHIIALLIPFYGVQGTVLLFAGFALNGIALALIYQPVQWHTKPAAAAAIEPATYEPVPSSTALKCKYCQVMDGTCMLPPKSQSVLSSQYLYNCDAVYITGYEIIDPGTPMMSHANDGWYSSTPAKRSLYSSKVSLSSAFVSRKTSYANLGAGGVPPAAAAAISAANVYKEKRIAQTEDSGYEDNGGTGGNDGASETPPLVVHSNRTSYVSLYKEGKQREKKMKEVSYSLKIDEADAEDCPSLKAPQDLSEKSTNGIISSGEYQMNNGVLKNVNSAKAMVAAADQLLPPVPKIIRNAYNTPPSRRISTNSFNAERDVLKNVCNRLEEYVEKEQCTCCNGGGAVNGGVFNKDNLQLGDEDDDGGDDDDGDDANGFYDENMELVKFTLWQKFCIFFDLDLLRDLTYVNLMVGVTVANFAELNYSILTPFVLADYGLTKEQTAVSMSLLGVMDISVRFFVPFIAGKIGWENKTFFLFGVMGMALGRICKFHCALNLNIFKEFILYSGRLILMISNFFLAIAHFHSYAAITAASCWIGLNKGLRTVFMALVIPSYIPLNRLPGATGLQLLFAGIFYFVMGPVIGRRNYICIKTFLKIFISFKGWIRDATDYTVTLHCLNIATYATAIAWGVEKLYTARKERKERLKMML